MTSTAADVEFMSQALELATQGRGLVEPNPLVGCVIVRDGEVVGSGYHQKFGGPHAEINALQAAGDKARGADVYVTLEPCCHQGKTGPCSQALIKAQVGRVVVGCQDPNPKVAGQGIADLQSAGIDVCRNVMTEQAQRLIAPFTKLLTKRHPWVIAKWAMTLDGKIASHTGSSQWISGEASRALVHTLRGQADAILVGRGTAEADNPLLTARPTGPRVATRIVLDSAASLPSESRLAQTANEAPVLVAASQDAPQQDRQRLQDLGIEVLLLQGDTHAERLTALLDELGQRHMTNLFVEGGGQVLGTLLDLGAIDEVHTFVATKLVGGQAAPGPIAGSGVAQMAGAIQLSDVRTQTLDADLHIHGYIR